MISNQKGTYQINNKQCQQCGACISICNQKAIDYERNLTTGLLDLKINQDKCIQCGLCFKICPANKDTTLLNIKEFCSSKSYYLGYNINKSIRNKSSSGGIAKSIIIEGLKNKLFDGVYTLKKTNKYPFAEGCFYTTENIPNYDDIPNSIYHSIPLNLNMGKIKRCDKILLVGTTCQLLALHRYVKNKCKQVYSLCIFCKQQKTFESTKFIAKLAENKIDTFNEITSISYRGNGWPGYCTFNTNKIQWNMAAIMPFGRKLWMVPGCNICGNPFGINADITLLDPWIIEDQSKLGKNLIIVHTANGHKLLNEVSNIAIEKKELSDIEPALMYDDIIKKNKLIPYFKGEQIENKALYKKGRKVEHQRKSLEKSLSKLPRLPLLFYRILNKLIKDYR